MRAPAGNAVRQLQYGSSCVELPWLTQVDDRVMLHAASWPLADVTRWHDHENASTKRQRQPVGPPCAVRWRRHATPASSLQPPGNPGTRGPARHPDALVPESEENSVGRQVAWSGDEQGADTPLAPAIELWCAGRRSATTREWQEWQGVVGASEPDHPRLDDLSAGRARAADAAAKRNRDSCLGRLPCCIQFAENTRRNPCETSRRPVPVTSWLGVRDVRCRRWRAIPAPSAVLARACAS